MDSGQRIERTLETALALASADPAPPGLAAAMRHAVFPGGARVRPRLLIAIAEACGGDAPALADGAAAAIELLHCASLVHDDMPCFDDAATRRGRPSVHAAFGEPLALLAGDALIVLAFETLARAGAAVPLRLAPLVLAIARGTGMPRGIVSGQAWECEADAAPEHYRCAKTGALFVATTMAGAIASGADGQAWRRLGEALGEAYQVADDLLDAVSAAEDAGKPVGRDAVLGRPSAVRQHGLAGAVALLQQRVDEAAASIPPCRGASELKELVRLQARRLVPKSLLQTAA